MPSATESVCCREIEKVVEKIGKLDVQCITQHEGSEAVCLNVWVLQMAYFVYKQRHGHMNRTDQELVEINFRLECMTCLS